MTSTISVVTRVYPQLNPCAKINDGRRKGQSETPMLSYPAEEGKDHREKRGVKGLEMQIDIVVLSRNIAKVKEENQIH